MNIIKAILFDHDGTLVDSERAHFDMWRIVLNDYGKILTFDEYSQRYSGIPTKSNAVCIISDFSLSVSPDELVRKKNMLTEGYLDKQAFPMMPSASESILTFYQLGLKVAIVTGAGRSGVEATVRENDLEKYISAIVSGDDVEHSKPSPDCYLLAVQQLGLNVDDCVAIEDTENGIASAVSANIKCIAVVPLSTKMQCFNKANVVCCNLQEVTQFVSEKYQLNVGV